MSSAPACQQCGSIEIEKDPARADLVCTNCGAVLEEQCIVSEIQFQEGAGGSSSVVGQFVSSETGASHSLGSSLVHGISNTNSRMMTLQNGRRKLSEIGAQLKLNQHCVETAYNFYKMAVNKKITRGRKNIHVLAACLYLVCRTEGTSHLLLDFSDLLQINVYTLGRTYLQLSRELYINIPATDPCLYIPRYAQKMDLGEKVHEVTMTAMRLVSRMKRDWLAYGRRPSGLCGAALLVSARLHGFSRLITDIVRVVRISLSTVRRRLDEFESTPSSRLTINEFYNIDLEEEHDPPAYIAGVKRRGKLPSEVESNAPELQHELDQLHAQVEAALEEVRVKNARHKRIGGLSLGELVGTDVTSCATTPASSQDDTVAPARDSQPAPSDVPETASTPSAGFSQLATSIDEPSSSMARPTDQETSSRQPDVLPPMQSDGDLLGRIQLETYGSLNLGDLNRPELSSLGLHSSIAECLQQGAQSVDGEGAKGESCALDLTGIDDAEIDHMILTPDEIERKTQIWNLMNRQFIEEQQKRREEERERREALEASGQTEPVKKRRRRRKRTDPPAASAGEAIEKMLQEKRISTKINYDVLRGLTETASAATAGAGVPEQMVPSTSVSSMDATGGEESGCSSPKRPCKVKFDLDLPSASKASLHRSGPTLGDAPDRVSVRADEPIVESGPLPPPADDDEELPVEDSDEEDDDDDDGQGTIKAIQKQLSSYQ